METFARPLVFEEYEAGKGAVDTANNRRDNMPSFHDVMKTYRWEIRCLSFFFAVAEANAFSAYKYVEIEDRMNHFEFRWRLAESLLDHARVMSEGLGEREPYQLRQANVSVAYKIVSLGKLPSGDYYRRLRCMYWHKRTQNS